MPYVLKDLVVDRVDLVDEGANSAAFIELYKRKESNTCMELSEILSKMKPEHASVVQQAFDEKDTELAKVKADLETAKADLASKDADLTSVREELAKAKNCECDGEADDKGMCKVCGKPKKKAAAFDETETLKSMPEAARELFIKMKTQKEAAEEMVRKNAEEKAEAEAIAKAASLKAIPVEQSKLAEIIKKAPQEYVDLLTTINAAIENTVLEEVGKNVGNGAATQTVDAWERLEAKAAEIAKRDNVTKEKAMATALDENPELYREYLNGGAK